MPLLCFDLVEGRSSEDLRQLLDAAHDPMLETFKVPPGDRFQIVHEHPAAHIIVEDTGLSIHRTEKRVELQTITRPRSREMRKAFFSLLCKRLQTICGIDPTDVVVSIISNTDDDWTSNHGRAQFLAGEL